MKIKNPNAPIERIKRNLLARWSQGDTPASEPRFQPSLFAKDIAIFLVLPITAVFLFKTVEGAISAPKKPVRYESSQGKDLKFDSSKSQILDFSKGGSGSQRVGKRTPGTLVKLKLLNVVETYGNAPVHAQVIDTSLGKEWLGATLVGDATGDTNFERINISFHLIRRGTSVASTLKARALSLNGSLGVEAEKKEGFFARSAFSAAGAASGEVQAQSESIDLNQLIARALATGLLQEFGNSANVERAKSQVLTVRPGEIFFAELTDYFPGESR